MTQFRSILIGGNLETCIKSLSRIPACDIDRCVDDALDRFNNTPLSTTITKYVAGADSDLWWMQEVQLDDRKNEMFPRINIHDLINMHSDHLAAAEAAKAEDKNKKNNNNKNNMTTAEKNKNKNNNSIKKTVKVLDIRPAQQFQQCHFPQSININISIVLQPQASSNKTKILQQLEQCKGSPIVVISAKTQKDEELEFCNTLVKNKFPYVTLLNGGIDALEHGAQSILIITSLPPSSNNNNNSNNNTNSRSDRSDDRSLSDRSFRGD
ncbi:hypothetical protein DFA_05096 [Cavenderia fasciculata]|uniref:Rhodanese domain-containing protein n=1 Tax=Cavenderia fasciculata TaxID=261658 RepID=F4PNB3_CACFS|nr:uncharacterized protein DFA_05096 [Cavenderia fasciculata]EGG22966.1 hypothetical protein DFA_05096 [Cavenderia fasciculata]|eukprot:XP_004360817.1 hypothetical protein DFA_05096 [Cavenderia fasciculata]